MDRPDLDFSRHRRALAGLARLNRWSNSAGIFWPAIAELAVEVGTPLRILDLASGGGDVSLAIGRRARQAGIAVEICGLDVSAQAVAIASDRARRGGVAVRFDQLDVLAEELPTGYDVIISSLFFHHLDGPEAVALLAKMAAAARHRVLVNDLERSRRGVLLAHLAARLLTLSPVVWVDAPRSVRAAFTVEEVRNLARTAGLAGTTVGRRWPCRLLLQWKRP
jgi:2-polyprenyl-3-methyl-5-hydroxy-6-metoxy-1,4-benzoquinol methylase